MSTREGLATADVVLDASGRVVVVTPRAPLAAYTTYYLVLSGVRDTAGNALSTTLSFTTGGQ